MNTPRLTPLLTVYGHVSVERHRAWQRDLTCCSICGSELALWPGDAVPHQAGCPDAPLCSWCVRMFGEGQRELIHDSFLHSRFGTQPGTDEDEPSYPGAARSGASCPALCGVTSGD